VIENQFADLFASARATLVSSFTGVPFPKLRGLYMFVKEPEKLKCYSRLEELVIVQ
jgi:hypothetical protein